MGIPGGKLQRRPPEDREMQRDGWRIFPRLLSGVGATIVCAAYLPTAGAVDPGFGYSNSYYAPYGGVGFYDNFRLRREMDRVDDQMKRQQRQLDEQIRLQQEQTRLLRQQQATQQRFTARQACYYRYEGGLDLCDRLFDKASKKHAACVEAVVEINPGCAADFAMPAAHSAD